MQLRTALPILFLCAACGSDDAADQPNVLLITLDTVRADYLSLGGGGKSKSPELEDIAAEGVWFSNASSASAVTPVSHASILTGRYQYNHGLRVLHAGSGYKLPEDQPTAATIFRAEGYRTGAVHSAFPVSGYFGFRRDYDHFDSFDGALQGKEDGSSGWDVRSLQRSSEVTTELALDFVSKSKDKPWFLWIHYWDPHDGALLPPAEWLGNAKTVDEVYAAEITYLDSQLGALVDGLRAQGEWDDTLFALTSDHGEGLSDGQARHGWAFHRVLYQEQLHVPLIVCGPGVEKRGRVGDLVRTVDMVPTLYDYAGVEGPKMDGLTLRPLIEGKSEAPRIAYADQVNGYDMNSKIAQRRPTEAFLNSVIEWPWKLIWRPHMPERAELFNLQDDPDERNNVIGQHPKVTMRLLANLVERDPWVTEPFAEPGADSASGALGALGYTGDGEEGSSAEFEWRWSCLNHSNVRAEQDGKCPQCGSDLFPVANTQ